MQTCVMCECLAVPRMQVLEHFNRGLPVGVVLYFCSETCFLAYLAWLTQEVSK